MHTQRIPGLVPTKVLFNYKVAFIRKTYEILIFVCQRGAGQCYGITKLYCTCCSGYFTNQGVVIRVLCHSIIFRPVSRHVKPPPHVTFHSSSKGKNPEDVAGSLVKWPIIGRFLYFKNHFYSIFCKHFISVLHFAIPFSCFAPELIL